MYSVQHLSHRDAANGALASIPLEHLELETLLTWASLSCGLPSRRCIYELERRFFSHLIWHHGWRGLLKGDQEDLRFIVPVLHAAESDFSLSRIRL